MKYFLSTLMIILFAHTSQAQSKDYNDLWEKVEKLENDGLPKSALDIVNQIAVQAKKDKNAPQQIKTLIYQSKYAMTLEEEAQLKVMDDFKKAIASSEAPTTNVLENMLATMYWQYFQQNRWKFYNRTNTASKVDATDFQTWDLQTLFDEIQLYFQKSLASETLLQQTKLESYSAILTEQKGSKTFRPTLYDLLAHNALEFYESDENSITKPAYKFIIDNADYLSDAKAFTKLSITSQDSTSLQLNALKLYQKLIAFHLKENNTDALVDVDIDRLKFVRTNTTVTNKDEVYLQTLKNSSNQYKDNAVSGLYDFEIASLYFEQGETYQPKTNEEHRWKIKEALEFCNAVIAKFPKSLGAQKCEVLKQEILQPSLLILSENRLPIQQNALMDVTYKNLEQLQFKIYAFSRSQSDKFKQIYRKEEQWAFISKLTATKQFQSTLKNESDYQDHSIEVVIPKLSNGTYLIVASKPNSDSNFFAHRTIQVTNIALVNTSENTKEIFQVIDRNNGKPLSGATVKLSYKNKYNGPVTNETKTTDSNGQFTITKNTNRLIDLDMEIHHNDDVAYVEDYYVTQYYKNNQEKPVQHNAFLFTDRSIYRPGQVVYFKGIAMSTENGKSQVTPNLDSKVVLYNVNREVIKELKVKTNEFGSVAGEFILPSDGLTGQFTIEFFAGVTAATYFSVEEYKRPKFETKFEPITETFKVNDSITVKGTALAYAGSNITDAKVVYRVSRQVQYPSWYYWRRPWYNSEPQEIAYGEGVTNEKGEFEIIFKAIPDESVDQNNLPVFQYEVTADVTDINGETRSATTIVNVGYHTLLATINVAEQLDKTKKDHKLSIDTRNLNGEFVPATGSIKIYKLKAPQAVLRPRPWAAPDFRSMTKEEFKVMFPHEAYDDEHNPNTWEKGTLVLDTTFDTSKSKELELGNIKKWESGRYVIVLESKDKFGQEIKEEAITTLFDDDDKTLADQQLFSVTTDKNAYSIGENVLLTFGSSAEDMTVTVDVEKDHSIVKTFIIPLSNNKKTIAIPVAKEDLGGFSVHYSYAAFNSFDSGTVNISVPYPKTDLQIETVTFRDKLQPGAEETWSFKIKGPKGDKVSAELLASMYDKSLDQFTPHDWSFSPLVQPIYNSYSRRNAGRSFGINSFSIYFDNSDYKGYPSQYYDELNWFGFYFGYDGLLYETRRAYAPSGVQVKADAVMMVEEAELDAGYEDFRTESKKALVFNSRTEQSGGNITAEIIKKEEKESFDNIAVRKNLNETSFFFPQLQTDAEGNVSFSFTTPEALTSWKLQLLAHTKNLESATTSMEMVTQKELMVIPNAPRFLRHGDQITISTKISNLTDNALSGSATLILTDAFTGDDISATLIKSSAVETFSVDAKGNTQVSWNLNIPENVNAVQYKVVAKAGDFSDGEQNALPVLSNRMLVTETLPMWIRSNETKTFTLDKLKTNNSSTLKNHKLTLEITSNPAWYAVQALPYLMEYPYDCNEQTFSRYYANALASHIANSNPRIQEVFNQWRNTDALLSNLEKNEELKNILIQETPWLRDAQSETEQKKRIALLFDLNKMNNELASAKRKLQNNQMNNGAWPWFEGGPSNRYITQHIITGFGHLKHLNVDSKDASPMIQNAINYLDAEFVKEYKDLKKYNKDVDLSKDHLSYTQLHYLYMRSFFPEIAKSKEVQTIVDYYQTQIQKYWLSRSLYAKGLMALVSHRAKDKSTSDKILKSLKETSITNEELGMYWKDNKASWFWYQAPIETQALMIEAFGEIQNDTKTIDNLKVWLLKHKQTNSWSTTKSTTEAVYALLLQGSDWLSVTDAVEILVGGETIEPRQLENVKVEAGTGYFKTAWNGSEVKPEMSTVQMTKKGEGIAWGALYWQYFEDLDKITTAETPLSLKKKLFLKTNTDRGEQISEITSSTKLNVGDLVRVRIELRSNRDMEFLHMKDMRAAGFEPVNVLSQYKYQDGLGYYESTKDAATNFFFDYLPKGTYVFEYDVRVNNAGNMSNGITTIQSMYAPEFSSHSEGVRVSVDSGQ
ncbi:MG2 domain-containing protein [Subsaxibacter sp. CAU 1640]|uniref:alpha-2-macroglobulin family protein n=1 Tax=Subsaxibacter sp. CAU 1640 TaxID=2933271 RepID=UPI0020058445|nr:alpha-2-macroglobulin family protein [Subsaxibacter sp. CAU 1640]MCK7591915.1 MG2 domain-containing protein [Subsaxibacter sp. CAU 1640]